jgi:Domain of unknown function (DUF1707)/Cell wall-active antibiotics response 4TMS YvqF
LAIVGDVDESSLQKREHQPQPTGERKPFAEAELRASDADRDRIAEILREALAEGRLDAEEHSERIDATYRARTLGELEPLVRDLPAHRAGATPRPAPATEAPHAYASPEHEEAPDNLVAIFGGATRKGRWRVGRRTNSFALFGGVVIDLTEAVFEQRETVIQTLSIFGGTDIKVPENVTLRCTGTGIFGGFEADTHESAEPGAPVVVVTGLALFGGVTAKRKFGKRLKVWGGDQLGG